MGKCCKCKHFRVLDEGLFMRGLCEKLAIETSLRCSQGCPYYERKISKTIAHIIEE